MYKKLVRHCITALLQAFEEIIEVLILAHGRNFFHVTNIFFKNMLCALEIFISIIYDYLHSY